MNPSDSTQSGVESYAPDIKLLKKVLERPVAKSALEVLDTLSDRLYERLALLKQPPTSIVDLGTGDARHLSVLSRRFPGASLIGADLCAVRLRQALKKRRFWQKSPMLVCLDASHALPFGDNSFDMVVSNMLLPWVFDAELLVAEINRVLAVDGAFFISTAGPDTLIELRNAWATVDDCTHINAFMDMHDLGDLLVGAGIADPVLDTERLTINYPSLDALLDELVGLGFINTLSGRRRGLMSPDVKQRLAGAYPLNDQGGVDATLELVVAHGWAGTPRSTASATDEFYFPLSQLRKGV